MDSNRFSQLFAFYGAVNQLKFTYRFSESPNMLKESTAAHSWRLSLMAFMVARELNLTIDVFRAMKIAIVHDIGECIHGDVDYTLVARGLVSKEEKRNQETLAFKKLCALLPTDHAQEIIEFWEDYEYVKSLESAYIKALDKIECLDRILVGGFDLFNPTQTHVLPLYADPAVKDFPELLPILREIKLRLKKEFAARNIPWKEEYDYGL